jgi:hypothetical protein
MTRLKNQKMTDQIWYRGKRYRLVSPLTLRDKYHNNFFIHANNGLRMTDKFSAFTPDGQYIAVMQTPWEGYKRFLLVAGKIKINKYKVVFKEKYSADITDYYYAYPDFIGDSHIEVAYNVDCKCFCIMNLRFARVAFFWKLDTSSDDIIIKELNSELKLLENMSIEIEEGSLSIIGENQIRLAGILYNQQGPYYFKTKNVFIIYDFSLGAVVSIEDAV